MMQEVLYKAGGPHIVESPNYAYLSTTLDNKGE